MSRDSSGGHRGPHTPAAHRANPSTRGASAHKRAFAHTDQAVDLCKRWLAGTPPWQLDRFLALALKEDRRLGRRDRQALSEAVFAFARYAGLVRAVLTLASKETLADGRADLATLQALPLDRAMAITLARYGREQWPLRGVDTYALGEKLGRAFTDIQSRAATEFSCFLAWHGLDPAWEAPLRARAQKSGWSEDDLREFVVRQTDRPPMWLRMNHPEKRQAIIDELSVDYDVDYDGDALAVIGPRGIYDLNCWKDGDIEIQDYASQQVGVALAPKAGETIWDACAGGGGKTLQAAALMQGRGAVHASDIRVKVLEEVLRRAKKANLHNVRTFAWNGEVAPPLPREAEKRGGFDAVLVDAPCTSSGTWRRNPDARYRYADIGDGSLVALQLRLLATAAQVVKPGGRLVYSTCSIRVEENEDVVERFLAGNSEFMLQREGMHGCPYKDSDAMFVALLLRKPG